MVNKTPKAIREMCLDYIRRGAPGNMTEITIGTLEENIKAFLEVMRTYESKEQSKSEYILPKD